jgi:ABC-type lipoprotein export system ATPase subunit
LDKFSLIALPIQYRLQLENFKRFLLHWPKYILSVIGEAMTGKSTLLTQLQEIDEPTQDEKESDERKQGKI